MVGSWTICDSSGGSKFLHHNDSCASFQMNLFKSQSLKHREQSGLVVRTLA